MNWDAMGAIGEVVGAVAVVVTLAYLAVQIRRSDLSTRAATTQMLLSKSSDLLIQNAASDLEGTHVSEHQSDLFRYAILNHYSNAHYQRSIGTLDDVAWEMFESRIERMVLMEGFENWWSDYQVNFSRQFRDYVDEIRGGASPRV